MSDLYPPHQMARRVASLETHSRRALSHQSLRKRVPDEVRRAVEMQIIGRNNALVASFLSPDI
jgi:hypothetical protein